MLDGTDIIEIDVENENNRIKIKKVYESIDPNKKEVTAKKLDNIDYPKLKEENDNIEEIVAPMVGTFYRAPAPDAEPFVEVGDIIKPGTTLCIIEAMKLMNEIEAEISGKIIDIVVDDGQAVEYGQPLFIVEPV